MKNYGRLSVFLLFFIAGCSPAVEEESIEQAALQQQMGGEVARNAITTETSEGNGNKSAQPLLPESSATRVNVYGNIVIESKTNPDPSIFSSLRVTVSKVEVRIVNGSCEQTLFPVLSSDIAGTENPISWESLSEGLATEKKILLAEPLSFECGRTADIYVTVNYTVSVRDENLATGLSVTKGVQKTSEWVMRGQESVDINVCIGLSPVLFDASVFGWDG